MIRFRLSPAFILIVSLLDISPVDYVWAKPEDSKKVDMQMVQTELKKKNFDKVITILSSEIEHLDRKGLFALAKAYSAQKKSEAAIKAYTAALALNPNDLEARTLIGAEQFLSGKEKEALATLKETIQIKNNFVPAYKLLIKIYEKRKNKYELRLLYQDLVEKAGPDPEYFNKLCELTTTDGLYDLSQKYCQQAIEKSPKVASNYVYLGMTKKQTGFKTEAESILKKTADDFPKSTLALLTYAQHQEEVKNFISAYSYYKKAILSDKKSQTAYLGLAFSALEIQKYQESLDAFKEACKIEKNSIVPFRRATNMLRTMKINDWMTKFETSSEKCGQLSDSEY